MTNTILFKIVNDKHNWIEKHKKLYPIKDFYYKIQKSNRSFYKALSSKRAVFILECKKASPSKGIICSNFNLKNISNVYKHYASVISILTDEKYFQGNFDFLFKVSKIVDQPLLCKDFIIDPWQIYFSRLHKADAVLLMLSILNDEMYYKLSKIAHSLNMGVLTEVTNVEECKRAISLKAKIVGINNRDLRDLSIDLNRTKILSSYFSNDVKIISESGISHYYQIRKLRNYVDGFLIGTSIMSEPNFTIAINKILIGENKICGLTREIDANISMKAGSIYGGLIFVPDSPRVLNEKIATKIISGSNLMKFVGVFCNSSIKDVSNKANYLSLYAVQLHGNENQDYINKLRKKLNINCKIWKAIDMNYPSFSMNLINVDRYIFDNGKGSGKPFDWSLINKTKLDNTIIAGGLTIENCNYASKLGCVGLDFNSGVESSPGIKDHNKINKVFKILRKY